MTKNFLTGLLLVLLVTWACKPGSTAKSKVAEHAHYQACRSVLKRIPEENVYMQNGAWHYSFNVLLVVCAEDLSRITPAQEQAIVQLSKREIARAGLQIISEAESLAFRDQFRKDVNALMGEQIASDAYINILVAGESM